MQTLEAGARGDLRLFYDETGRLRLTVGEERSYLTVKVYQAWPLSLPGRCISLQDGQGEEIVLVDRLDHFSTVSRPVIEEELRRRYLTSRVLRIVGIRTEFGVTYWDVVTDRGERDFVIQSLTESCVWLGEHHLLLVDPEGNRFEITDRRELD